MEEKSNLPEDANQLECNRQKATFAIGLENKRLMFGSTIVISLY